MTNQHLSRPQTPKALHITLWILQILLGAAFLAFGLMKLTQPIAQLTPMLPWTANVPEMLVRFIGLSEALGAIGLVLPAATRIQPRLTGFAAIGLILVMVLAMLFHLSRGEAMMLPMNLIFAGLAAVIAWGRLVKAPIQAR